MRRDAVVPSLGVSGLPVAARATGGWRRNGRRRAAFRAVVWLTLGGVIAHLRAAEPVAHAPADAGKLRAFFGTYCTECHGPEKQKGDRRFDQLALPVASADALNDLQDVIDQLNLGDMPPAKAPRHPEPAEARAIVTQLTQLVAEGHARLSSTGGQTVLRRLNRREYLNTVGDLFGLNLTMFDPTTKFPRDQMAVHMDNIGDTLRTSGYLLAQYIEAADQVVEKAFSQPERPAERGWHFGGNFQQQPELRYSHGKVYNYRYLCLYETTTSDKHEGAYGPLLAFASGVPADGWYEIRVKAEAKYRKNRYAPNFFGTDPAMPFRLSVVAGNAKAGALHLPQAIEPQLAGEVLVRDDEPEWYTFRVWLDRGYTPRFIFPNGMLNVRNAYSRLLRQYNQTFPAELRATTGIVEARVVVMRHGELPHIRIHEVDIRGPLVDQWPAAGFQSVLGGQPFAPERTREILERFAARAYRRPVRSDEVDRLMQVVETRRGQGQPPFAALKDGLKAALCSPAFLYLVEPANAEAPERRLAATALASRLSYFFWSTMPDEPLRRAAESGDLLHGETLAAETRRLLASPRADAFINGFLDAWLNLRSLGDMAPDRGDFLRYYAQNLQPAMKRETQLFTRDLLERNDSILRFLDANYSFVNRPLARLYGLENAVAPEKGHEFQRVTFPNPQRGGLLGQGSILTVSANGIETSPVIRGVWVLENILGTPPPPPPDNVPPIDPDIRGAKTMREILAKHRDSPACYECHRKIDPLGFALENFDPIGAWRTQYGKGLKIDASGELPNGAHFADVAGLKQALLARKEQFARMLTERLLTYACGRRMEPLDRPAIDRILAAVQPNGYRFRDLLEQVVASQPFRTK
jgi:mono/diheme cytochrome c family protein